MCMLTAGVAWETIHVVLRRTKIYRTRTMGLKRVRKAARMAKAMHASYHTASCS